MKREEIRGIVPGITDEQLQQVLDLHSNDIESHKQTITTLQGQLKTAKDGLKAFEGVDVDDLKGQIDQLGKDLADKDAAYQRDLAERDFSAALDAAIQAQKGRSGKAIRAMLDLDALLASKDRQADINAALDTTPPTCCGASNAICPTKAA